MSIFENMDARQIAMCLSAFYEACEKDCGVFVYLPNRKKPIVVDRESFDEGIMILRDDYGISWTPGTKPDDLKWETNKRLMKGLQEHVQKNSYIDTDHVLKKFASSKSSEDELATLIGLMPGYSRKDLYDAVAKLKDECDKLHEWKKMHHVIENSLYGASTGITLGPGCVVNGNDWMYRRALGLPYDAMAADILEKILSIEAEAQEKDSKNKVIIDTLRDNLVDSIEECKKLKGQIRGLISLLADITDADEDE